MSTLSSLPAEGSKAEGHCFDHNTISGGAVHFGDVYNYAYEQDVAQTSRLRSGSMQRRASELSSLQKPYIVPKGSTAQFTGRNTQLQQIRQCLTAPLPSDDEYRHKIVVLLGLGGSGKSQVCLRYAEINRDSYWGIFWIDASSLSTAEAGYAFLGQQAGLGPTWAAGKYWLSQQSQPWLLILDNADDKQIDISNFLPPGKSGHVLITTRDHDQCLHATAGQIDFGKMEPEEAIELLLRSAYAGASQHDYDPQQTTAARGIAAALGYLAIALNQAGTTIRRKIYTIEDYLHLYLGDRHRLLNSRNISREEIDVITTWEIPFKRIEQQRSLAEQDAVVLMCIFAFLHFESIPEELFHDIWQKKERPAWFDGLPDFLKSGSKQRLRRAITVLSEFSIIDLDSDKGVCSLHPVVHQWAKSRIDSDDKMVAWLQCTLCLLSCCSPEKFTAALGLSILPHIDYCLEITSKHAPAILTTHQGIDQIERFASMYGANGAWKKALPILEKVLDFRLRKQGWWHEDTLTTQRNVARCLWNLFEVKAALEVQLKILQARWYLRPSPKDWIRFLRPDHVSYCLALDDLTQTLWLAGISQQSIRTGRRAVEGLAKHLGYDDPRTWNAMFNLGRTYRHTGDLIAGHRLLSFVARKRKSHLGRDHLDTLMARSELGMSFWARGQRLAVAQGLITSVRDARTRILGRDHAYTLWSSNDLSKILCTRGRPREAVEVLETIVPIVEQTLGHDHVGMHMTKANLGLAYALCRDWTKAENTVLEIFATIDDNHRDWFSFMFGYARIESELGHFGEALDTCNKMLQHATSKKDSPGYFKIAVELQASVYFRAGQIDELNSLKQQYPWISDANVEKPPSPMMLTHSV